jgi:hypothetical protein
MSDANRREGEIFVSKLHWKKGRSLPNLNNLGLKPQAIEKYILI